MGINGLRYACEVWARYAETKIHGRRFAFAGIWPEHGKRTNFHIHGNPVKPKALGRGDLNDFVFDVMRQS